MQNSDEVSVLKTRIRLLEQRKQRLLAALGMEGNTQDHYFSQSELERIEYQLQHLEPRLLQYEKTFCRRWIGGIRLSVWRK